MKLWIPFKTLESSQGNEVFTQYENYEVGLDLKVEFEHLKIQVVKEVNYFLINEIIISSSWSHFSL